MNTRLLRNAIDLSGLKFKRIASIAGTIMATNEVINIDGSQLEGGGQILRVALTMSTLCMKPIKIKNIRAGRSKPGLMEQHLIGLQLVGQLSSANIWGDSIQSQSIVFFPSYTNGGDYVGAIKTAGSVSLLLQAALPCALFANGPTQLTLQGGTNAEMAPQIDYTTKVFRLIMEKFGATFDFKLIKRGCFPRGGGKVIVNVTPVERLKPVVMLDPGHVTKLYGWSFVTGKLSMKIAHEMSRGAIAQLKTFHTVSYIDIKRDMEDRQWDNCSGIILVCVTSTGCVLGSSALGRKNERPYKTGCRAAVKLLQPLSRGACLDDYAQDQVIVLMALADGLSRIRVGEITMHTKTAIHVVEQITTVKFNVIQDERGTIIECNGLGLSRN